MQGPKGEQQVCMFEESMTELHLDSRTQVYCGLCIVLQSQTVSPSFHTGIAHAMP
jgi:hypothetical protein